MNEEALKEEFDITDFNEEQEEVEQVEQIEEPKEVLPKGHISKDEWVAQGKDPNEWQSPEIFKERRHWIGEITKVKRDLQSEFDNRLANANLVLQGQLANARRELEARRDNAIDTADRDEVKAIDKQLKALDAQEDLIKDTPKQQQAKSIEVQEWEAENPWCNDPNDPRLPVAQEAYTKALQSGKTLAAALRAADKAVLAVEPVRTRQTPPRAIADSPRSSHVPAKDAVTLRMNQCTSEELSLRDLFGSDAEFLKAVSDSRK